MVQAVLCFIVMVRLLVLSLILVSVHARAVDDIYLSSSQKAALSLGLKAVLLKNDSAKKDDAEYIIKTMLNRAKTLAVQEKRIVEVASYEQFIKLQKNSDLYQNKLMNIEVDRLLAVMPDPVYISRSQRIQRRINAYYQEKLKLAQMVGATALGVSFDFASDTDTIRVDDFQKYVKEKINTYTDGFVQRLTKDTNSPYVSVVAKLLKMYFEMLPSSQKAEILFRLLQLPLKPDANEVFLTMIQNTGPQMQKLVQIIGRNPAIPEEFRTIFQKLESQVQPVPWEEVKKLVSSEVNMDEFSYFEKAALGVGTMAQTHRVQRKGLAHGARTFVIRFLKPGIENLVEMDHGILIQIATLIDTDPDFKQFKLPSLRRQVEDVHESVVEELGLELTTKNQIEGKGIYEKSIPISYSGQKNILEIHVPDTQILGKTGKLMQQEIIFGKKVASEIANYSEAYPQLYAAVAEVITEQWLEQAFFKSGFFHADLHQGNLLMRVTDDKVQVNLLDFGMVGHLNTQQRNSVLLLALGLKLDNVDLIADSFSKLTRVPMDEATKQAFKGQVFQRVQQIKSGEETSSSIEAWAAWSVTKGLDLHYEFVKLNRGIMAISSLLDESKSKQTFESIALNLVMKNKTIVLGVVAKQDFVKYSELLKFGFGQLQSMQSKKASEPKALTSESTSKSAAANKCVSLFM